MINFTDCLSCNTSSTGMGAQKRMENHVLTDHGIAQPGKFVAIYFYNAFKFMLNLNPCLFIWSEMPISNG